MGDVECFFHIAMLFVTVFNASLQCFIETDEFLFESLSRDFKLRVTHDFRDTSTF